MPWFQDGTLDAKTSALIDEVLEVLSFEELRFGGAVPKPGSIAAASATVQGTLHFWGF